MVCLCLDLQAYQGENYVPEEYRNKEIEGLELYLKSNLKYQANALSSIKIKLDNFEGKMHIHPLRIKNFKGRFQYEDDNLMVNGFKGEMGRTNFEINMNYYLGADEASKKRDNVFSLKSDYIDFDALTNFNPKAASESTLGHMDISGTQDMNNEIYYFVRIPLRMVMKATKNKIFGAKQRDAETKDEIIKRDTTKRTRYLNLNIKGTLDDYDIKIGKEKS